MLYAGYMRQAPYATFSPCCLLPLCYAATLRHAYAMRMPCCLTIIDAAAAFMMLPSRRHAAARHDISLRATFAIDDAVTLTSLMLFASHYYYDMLSPLPPKMPLSPRAALVAITVTRRSHAITLFATPAIRFAMPPR